MTAVQRFELDRLGEYTDEAICIEIQRVAALAPEPILTKRIFDSHSRVSASTVCHRFGSWKGALDRAELAHRYSGQPASEKMINQHARSMSDDDVVAEIQRVARHLGQLTFSYREFNNASHISYSAVLKRFGSWRSAIERSGLSVSIHGRRYSDEECFENLLSMWTHLGRPPLYREMNITPSTVGGKAYVKRWGKWNKALMAFVDCANNREDDGAIPTSIAGPVVSRSESAVRVPEAERRDIRLGLRYQVLQRDGFRCVVCGNSPALTPGVQLHVDHIVPFSRGGRTVSENLRSTCSRCNIGKGSRYEDS